MNIDKSFDEVWTRIESTPMKAYYTPEMSDLHLWRAVVASRLFRGVVFAVVILAVLIGLLRLTASSGPPAAPLNPSTTTTELEPVQLPEKAGSDHTDAVTPTNTPNDDELAVTGSSSKHTLILGLGLVGIGATAVVFARSRQEEV